MLDPAPGDRTIFYRRKGVLTAVDTVNPQLRFAIDTIRLSDTQAKVELLPTLMSEDAPRVVLDGYRISTVLSAGECVLVGGIEGTGDTLGSLFFTDDEQTLLVIHP